jgi:hypothetical protein
MTLARVWPLVVALCLVGTTTADAQQMRQRTPRVTAAKPLDPMKMQVSPVAKLSVVQKNQAVQGLLKTAASVLLSEEFSLSVAKPVVPDIGGFWLQNAYWVTTVLWNSSSQQTQYLPDGVAFISNQDEFDKGWATDNHVAVWLSVPVGRQYLVDCRVNRAKKARVVISPSGNSPSNLLFQDTQHLTFLVEIKDSLQRLYITGSTGTEAYENGIWEFYGCDFSMVKK